jgi:hypothetical protein
LTLLEAVLALAVFSTGVVALFGMINNVSSANRSSSFHRNSLDLFSRLSSQIRDAQCHFDGNGTPPYIVDYVPPYTVLSAADPGLDPALGWRGTAGPVVGSAITAVGNAQTNAAIFAGYVPPMEADYLVTDVTVPGDPPTLRIDVRIREITNDPMKDGSPTGPWVREYPIQKTCAPRYDGMPRGAFF